MSYSNAIRRAAGLLGVLIAARSLASPPAETVCRDQPRPGSHIVMHTCATEAQWAVAEKSGTVAVLRMFAHGVDGSTGTGVVTSTNSSPSTFQR